MKIISTQIDDDTHRLLEISRADRSMSEFLREIIVDHFHEKDRDSAAEMVAMLNEILNKKTAEMEAMLNERLVLFAGALATFQAELANIGNGPAFAGKGPELKAKIKQMTNKFGGQKE